MGIEAFLIASAVDCVVAQRLARKLCSHCKRRTIVRRRRWPKPRSGRRRVEAYEPVGCARCNQSGYSGRVGLYSVMALSERIKEMASTRPPRPNRRRAREEGMLTLREDGLPRSAPA
jgi:type IV pilus assembly protein PilB